MSARAITAMVKRVAMHERSFTNAGFDCKGMQSAVVGRGLPLLASSKWGRCAWCRYFGISLRV